MIYGSPCFTGARTKFFRSRLAKPGSFSPTSSHPVTGHRCQVGALRPLRRLGVHAGPKTQAGGPSHGWAAVDVSFSMGNPRAPVVPSFRFGGTGVGARRVQSYLLRRYDWSPRVYQENAQLRIFSMHCFFRISALRCMLKSHFLVRVLRSLDSFHCLMGWRLESCLLGL